MSRIVERNETVPGNGKNREHGRKIVPKVDVPEPPDVPVHRALWHLRFQCTRYCSIMASSATCRAFVCDTGGQRTSVHTSTCSTPKTNAKQNTDTQFYPSFHVQYHYHTLA